MAMGKVLLVCGALLLGALGVTGAGMAMGWGQSSMAPWNHGPGPMMGQSGHGSMMGGYYSSPSAEAPVVAVTQVHIANFAFTPANIQVPVGTTVTWTNLDSAPHTVTFKQGMKGSGVLEKGQSFSYTFTEAGTFQYDCAVHPYMTATVTVTS
jgi:amicyanin